MCSCTVNPVFIRNIFDRSSLIIITDSHGSSINVILYSYYFGIKSGFFFHFI
jgi:hypothetical protein